LQLYLWNDIDYVGDLIVVPRLLREMSCLSLSIFYHPSLGTFCATLKQHFIASPLSTFASILMHARTRHIYDFWREVWREF